MSEKTIYTVATAHLDTIWNWSFETTVADYIPKTLRKNFELFRKYPDYRFNFEGAYRYELMEEYYPEQFEQLKAYVKSGKWNVTGSAYENGDCNIPSPEALFRNFLYGNSYFDKTFGRRSKDVFLPDCFGFGYALPSIAAHSNLLGFTTQKLSWGSAYGIPFDIGKWYGVNGKPIFASLNMGNYVTVFTKIRENEFIRKKLKENEAFGLPMTAGYHGVGDRGGAPLEISVHTMQKEIDDNGKSTVKVKSAASDELYRDLASNKALTAKLPTWHNELLMTRHGAGCYTSRAISKRWNERNEVLADMAERASVGAMLLSAMPYAQETLDKAWKRVIAHQFHDDLTGTSLQKEYRRSWNDYVQSLNQFSDVFEASAAAVIGQLDTSFCKGRPIVVWNSQDFTVQRVVTFPWDDETIRVFDDQGVEVPSQTYTDEKGRPAAAIWAKVPPCGCRVFDVRVSKTPYADEEAVMSADKSRLENERVIVRLDNNGDVSSIYDKTVGQQLLRRPITFDLLHDECVRTYPAWEMTYEDLMAPVMVQPQKVSAELLYSGPCIAALRLQKRYGASTFQTIVTITRGTKVVSFQNEIDWHEHETMCKVSFPLNVENDYARYDLGLGSIERSTNTRQLFEVPAQRWAAIRDRSGAYGVGVLSDSKRGWDKPDAYTLRLTALHTPKHNFRPDSMQSQLDLGLNRFGFAVCSFAGDNYTSLDKRARQFCTPLTVFAPNRHKGALGRQFSLFTCSDDSVVVRAVKKAQDSDEIVVRVNEVAGKKRDRVTLRFCRPVVAAREIYASEEPRGALTPEDGAITFDIDPFDVRSFALCFDMKPSQTFKHKPAELPMNTFVLTKNDSRDSVCLPNLDYALPAELMPSLVQSGGLPFELQTDPDRPNALLCNGQTIDVPAGAKAFCFIGCALGGDRDYAFTVGDETVTARVQDIAAPIGKWDLTDLGEGAAIKRDPLAFSLTHTHGKDGDNIGKQTYFFRYEIPVEKAAALRLPVHSDLLLLSALFKCETHAAAPLTTLYDEVAPRVIRKEAYAGDTRTYRSEKARCFWRRFF